MDTKASSLAVFFLILMKPHLVFFVNQKTEKGASLSEHDSCVTIPRSLRGPSVCLSIRCCSLACTCGALPNLIVRLGTADLSAGVVQGVGLKQGGQVGQALAQDGCQLGTGVGVEVEAAACQAGGNALQQPLRQVHGVGHADHSQPAVLAPWPFKQVVQHLHQQARQGIPFRTHALDASAAPADILLLCASSC